MRSARHLAVAGAVVALIAAGFFLPQLCGGSQVIYGTCVAIAIFAVMAYGVDVVLSYLGEVSLGHTVFWAIGGYVSAILATRYGANGWLTALATIGASLIAALILGLATLRTRAAAALASAAKPFAASSPSPSLTRNRAFSATPGTTS